MTSSTIPKITALKAFQQEVDREIKTIKSDIEKNGLKLANKIGEDAKITPKITTKLVIQMAAVTQRISNLEDNLQEDKNTALVNRLKKLEHESANSNIIAIISFLQIFITSFAGAVQCPNFKAFKQSISNIRSTHDRDLAGLYTKVKQKKFHLKHFSKIKIPIYAFLFSNQKYF